ncbi:hypothetical protein Emin_0727 [Elusimicrobium minutum Pei191]|uniref:L,D-TPase catalytic domain-containing protein n=1 Tax=Elusimicrobium minutum (strain Pei191) TaxID=445932 RepID=B2KCN6_ELUMP|nr:L,D-transpeptidase family protein [Elusimicrobium minutum]ACC98282.1 hypothetical protein Emin_0727 [Elusimicrobium minutum Pei191]
MRKERLIYIFIVTFILLCGVLFFALRGNAAGIPLTKEEQENLKKEIPENAVIDKIVILKEKRIMEVSQKEELLKSYKISLGFEPKGHKEQQGDGKTPEGIYKVDGKNPHSRYYKNLGVSYPNDKDRAAAKAKGINPGGDIKIHGIGKDYWHIKENILGDWTLGCIAVTNAEIDEIYNHTPIGITVEIKP